MSGPCVYVQVQGFYTEETATFKYKRPVKVMSCMHIVCCAQHALQAESRTLKGASHDVQSVALDPRYGSRKTREFVTGGLAGQLLLSSKVMRAARAAVMLLWGSAQSLGARAISNVCLCHGGSTFQGQAFGSPAAF